MAEVPIPFEVITPAHVRASVRRARASLEKAAAEIVWQIEREAWRTLGYRSWDAMREAEYGGAAFMVPRRQRPELVERMRAKGLTQQEIADTAGVSIGTVNSDLTFSSENDEDSAAITNSRGQERPATYQTSPPAADPDMPNVEDLQRSPGPPSGVRNPATAWGLLVAARRVVSDLERLVADAGTLTLDDDHRQTLDLACDRIGTGGDLLRSAIHSEHMNDDALHEWMHRDDTWAMKVQRISATIPSGDLTDEQLADAQGAAEFLFFLLRGETKLREGRGAR